MAGNQLGKCVSYQTLIDHPDGTSTPIGELYERGGSFPVVSWSNGARVDAVASCALRKAAEPMVRLFFSDGQHLDCALRHRVLTEGGFVFVSQLVASVPCLLGNDSEFDRSARALGVRRWLEKASGLLDHCFACRGLYDALPHPAAETGQFWQPLPGDVLPHSQPLSPSDGHPSICKHSHQQWCDRLSSLGEDVLSVARSVGLTAQDVYMSAQRMTWKRLASRLLSIAGVSGPQSGRGVLGGQSSPVALVSPSGEGNQIIGYAPIGVHDLYDMTVPIHSNYIAHGCVHHNTLAGAAEWAMHLTGRYPDWWPGHVFENPVRMWASGVTGEATRDNPQNMLLGPPAERDAWGTGMIPKDAIVDHTLARGTPDLVDTLIIRHGGGGDIQADHSYLWFKTYIQGRQKWQGPTLDGVWFDEEPPLDIYSEGRTRTQRRGIFTMMTFTPLEGMSETVAEFLLDEGLKGEAPKVEDGDTIREE